MGKRSFLLALGLAIGSLCMQAQDVKYAQTVISLPGESSEWEWLSTEIGRYVQKKDSADIDYFEYDSHPQYKVSNEFYVFDSNGNLVHCHNLPEYGTELQNYLISNVLMEDFEKDKAGSGLSEVELEDVKSNISSIANYTFDFDGFGETASPVMNYISKLYLAKKDIFIQKAIAERDGDNSFSFSIGNGNVAYTLYCNYVGKGNYKVERELKVEKGRKQNNAATVKKDMVLPPSPTKGNDDQAFVIAEKMPSFNGNISAWLANNLEYPQVAVDNGIEGRVMVRFVVDKDGSIANASIMKSVSPSLDGEALRVVRLMPKWNPGMNQGKTAAVWFTLPVTFRL